MLDTLIAPDVMWQFALSKPVQLVAEATSLGSIVVAWRAKSEPTRRFAALLLGSSMSILACWFVGYFCGMTN
jgi:hypothetical protein